MKAAFVAAALAQGAAAVANPIGPGNGGFGPGNGAGWGGFAYGGGFGGFGPGGFGNGVASCAVRLSFCLHFPPVHPNISLNLPSQFSRTLCTPNIFR